MKTMAEVARTWSTKELCFARAEFTEEEGKHSEWYKAIVAELKRRESAE